MTPAERLRMTAVDAWRASSVAGTMMGVEEEATVMISALTVLVTALVAAIRVGVRRLVVTLVVVVGRLVGT